MKVRLPCPFCGRERWFDETSHEANGVFEPYCPDGKCEDQHVWDDGFRETGKKQIDWKERLKSD